MGSLYLNKSQVSFLVVIVVLISVSVLYIALHAAWQGKKYSKLSDEDKTVLTLMLSDTTNQKESKEASIKYIVDEIAPIDTAGIYKKYVGMNNLEMIASLPNIKILTRSYFWLNGEAKYLEVVFWSIFGVLTSLLYFASEALRLNKFRMEEIPVYFAKIFYTPFIVLIIVFSFKLLTSAGNIAFDESSIELIIFSYILGFFSGRAIELLNKIKEIILPGKDKPEGMEEGTVILTGKVTAKDDDIDFTKDKARVTIFSSIEEKEIDSVETNEERIFFFKNINPGIYNIKAELTSDNGSYIAEITGREIKKENPIEIENIIISKKEPDNE